MQRKTPFPQAAASPPTARECRALLAASIDRAIEESCVVRDELIDRAMDLDDQATLIDKASLRGDRG